MPPDILDYPTSSDMVVREGSNVTLKCAATGSPKPTIVWRREDGDMIPVSGGQEGNSPCKRASHPAVVVHSDTGFYTQTLALFYTHIHPPRLYTSRGNFSLDFIGRIRQTHLFLSRRQALAPLLFALFQLC